MVVSYQDVYRQEVKNLFFENVPTYFAEEEWLDLEQYLDQNGETYFCAQINSKIVGCGGYHFSNDSIARLSWSFMHPNYIRKGIGKRLILHCTKAISQNPAIQQIEVWTSQYAYQFYEKLGLSVVKIKRDYWAKGFDLYKMEVSLSQ